MAMSKMMLGIILLLIAIAMVFLTPFFPFDEVITAFIALFFIVTAILARGKK